MGHDVLFDCIISILASAGLLTVIWAVYGFFLLKYTRRLPEVYTVISAKSGMVNIEQSVRSAQWKHSLIFARGGIIILDAGMDGETKKAAEALAKDDSNVIICGEKELAGYIMCGDGGKTAEPDT